MRIQVLSAVLSAVLTHDPRRDRVQGPGGWLVGGCGAASVILCGHLLAPAPVQAGCIPPLAADVYRQVRINGGSINEALLVAANEDYYDGTQACYASIKALIRSDPGMYRSIDPNLSN